MSQPVYYVPPRGKRSHSKRAYLIGASTLLLALIAGGITVMFRERAHDSPAALVKLVNAAPKQPGQMLDYKDSEPGNIDTQPSAEALYYLPGTPESGCVPVFTVYRNAGYTFHQVGNYSAVTDVGEFCHQPRQYGVEYDLLAYPPGASVNDSFLELTLSAPTEPRTGFLSELTISAQR